MPFNLLLLRSAQSGRARRQTLRSRDNVLPLRQANAEPRTKKEEEEKKLWSFVDLVAVTAPLRPRPGEGGAQRMTAANTTIKTRSDALSPGQPAACWTPLGGRMGVRRVHLPLRLGDSVGMAPKLYLC